MDDATRRDLNHFAPAPLGAGTQPDDLDDSGDEWRPLVDHGGES